MSIKKQSLFIVGKDLLGINGEFSKYYKWTLAPRSFTAYILSILSEELTSFSHGAFYCSVASSGYPKSERPKNGSSAGPPLGASAAIWGIKARAETALWKHKWWGPRPTESRGKDRDKAPNWEWKKGDWKCWAILLIAVTIISTSEIRLRCANTIFVPVLAMYPLGSVLDKHFFKSDLLANGATWILCRWVGAEKHHVRFWGWYSEMRYWNGMLGTNFMIPILAEQTGTGRQSIDHWWRCS